MIKNVYVEKELKRRKSNINENDNSWILVRVRR